MKVTFQIEGGSPVTIECNAGDNLLELARRANVAIDAPCSGNGSCGKCRVKLLEGEVDSYPSRHITDEEYEAGWRLSCNCKVVTDCTVFVPDIASAYQSRMKTADLSSPEEVAIFEKTQEDLHASGIVFENKFLALSLEMSAPSEEDTMPDNERLTWAIQAQLGDVKVEIPYIVMVKLASTLREHDFKVTVKGEHRDDRFLCMEICGPEDTAVVGCAIDIGTTTVSMVLTDLKEVLRSVAASDWMKLPHFATKFDIAKANYYYLATPGKQFHNTHDYDFLFDLDKTSDHGSQGNISFAEYVSVKLATLEEALKKVEQHAAGKPSVSADYYIRGIFNNWEVRNGYEMVKNEETGLYSFDVNGNRTLRLKVFSKRQDEWYGTECLAEDNPTPCETDDHRNIILPAGSYTIQFDPATKLITILKR